MKKGELMKDYFSRVIEIVYQMKPYGKNISDEKIVKKILLTLTEKYDDIVAIIEETKLSKISIEQFIGSLESHEQRKNRYNDEEIEETALQAKFNMKYKTNIMKKNNENGEEKIMENKSSETKMFCEICKRTNHVSGDSYFKGKPQCNLEKEIMTK